LSIQHYKQAVIRKHCLRSTRSLPTTSRSSSSQTKESAHRYCPHLSKPSLLAPAVPHFFISRLTSHNCSSPLSSTTIVAVLLVTTITVGISVSVTIHRSSTISARRLSPALVPRSPRLPRLPPPSFKCWIKVVCSRSCCQWTTTAAPESVSGKVSSAGRCTKRPAPTDAVARRC